MTRSNISWLRNPDGSPGRVWNPVVGCTPAHTGCQNCYAAALHAQRHAAYKRGAKLPVQYADPFDQVWILPERLQNPVQWKTPSKVFVNSMSDLFHPEVPDAFLHLVYSTMEQLAPHHTYIILTKRAQRMKEYLRWRYGPRDDGTLRIPSRHIWHGISVSDQATAKQLIPDLVTTPSAVRLISIEPLLSGIRLRTGIYQDPRTERFAGTTLDGIHGVFVGGESGTNARSCDVFSVVHIVGQCLSAKVPVYVKQLGSKPVLDYYCKDHDLREWALDRPHIIRTPEGAEWSYRDGQPPLGCTLEISPPGHKGEDLTQWPKALRIQQFPEVRR